MKKIFFILLIMIIAITGNINIAYSKGLDEKANYKIIRQKITELDYAPIRQGLSGYKYYDVSFDYNGNPMMWCINSDNSYSVCVSIIDRTKTIKIYELNSDGVIKVVNTFTNEFNRFGGFTKDRDGNYYLLFGGDEKLGYILIKYDSNANELKRLEISKKDCDTLVPFESGTCTLIENSGVIAVHDGRLIDSAKLLLEEEGSDEPFVSNMRHQGSCLFMVDTTDMKLIKVETFVASHSFEQDILYDNGNFVFVDRGDAQPRGYLISKYSITGDFINSCIPFNFKGGVNYNKFQQGFSDGNTYSQYGGIIEIKDKYVLMGTYENTVLDLDDTPRNLFIQYIDKNTLEYDEPIYLTDYKLNSDGKSTEIGNPKIIKCGDDQFAIFYDEYSVEGDMGRTYHKFLGIKLILIDGNGNVIASKDVKNDINMQLPYINKVIYNEAINSFDWFGVEGVDLIKYSIITNDNNFGKDSINKQFENQLNYDKIKVILNGENLNFIQEPIIKYARVLVPMRTIFERMGATVEWNSATSTIFAEKDSTVISVKLWSNKALVNGKTIELPAPVIMENGTAMVPLRFISESFGADVDWDNENRTVTINT
ncbi:MAG: copper amine oxidase N-terminal domain-containing protein [Clostridia bacterium]|nr:copper amine oxidase N-terminal domain-containing protein [Clostridia bacterium]